MKQILEFVTVKFCMKYRLNIQKKFSSYAKLKKKKIYTYKEK